MKRLTTPEFDEWGSVEKSSTRQKCGCPQKAGVEKKIDLVFLFDFSPVLGLFSNKIETDSSCICPWGMTWSQ